jgi:CHAT domain-containing protein
MFIDPAGQYRFALPLGWAYDPERSHLITVRFAHWQRTREAVTARAMPTFAPPEASLEQWYTALEKRCVSPLMRPFIQLRCGGLPAALAEAHEIEPEVVHRRILVVRGPRLDVIAEHRTPEPSEGPRCSEPLSAICHSLEVPTNRYLPTFAKQETVSKDLRTAMDAMQRAQWNEALDTALRAQSTARDVYLYSVVENTFFPEIPAITALIDALMMSSQAGFLMPLRDAEHLALRALNTLRGLVPRPRSAPDVEQALRERLDAITGLHTDIVGRQAPDDSRRPGYGLAQLRADTLLAQAMQFRAAGEIAQALWIGEAAVADATMLLRRIALDIPFDVERLPAELRKKLTDAGANTPEKQIWLARRIVWRSLFQDLSLRGSMELLSDLRAGAGDMAGSIEASAFYITIARALGETEAEDTTGNGFAIPEEQPASLASALIVRANSLVEVEDEPSLKEAHEALDEAEQILDRIGETGTLRARLCLSRVSALHAQRRTEGALETIERGLHAAAVEPERARLIVRELKTIQSQFLIQAGKFEEARAVAAEVVATSDDEDSTPLARASHHLNLAIAAVPLGDVVEAEQSLRAALREALAISPFSETTLRILMVASRVYEERSLSLSHLLNLAAASVLDARRTTLGPDELRVGFDDSSRRRAVYEDLIGRLLTSGEGVEAVATADRSRARALNELLAAPAWSGSAATAENVGPPPSLADDDVRQALRQGAEYVIRSAEATLLRKGAALLLQADEVAQLAQVVGVPILMIQPVRQQAALLLVHPSGEVETALSPRSLNELQELTEAVQKQFYIFSVSRGEDVEAGAIHTEGEDLDRALASLWEGFIGPIHESLAEEQPLIIAPYREFTLVPFALLRDPKGRPLIERHALSLIPSLSVLRTLRQRGAWNRTLPHRAYVAGDPALDSWHMLPRLLAARAEAKAVADSLTAAGVSQERVLLRLDVDAHENSYRQEARRCDLIHLACHAKLESPAYTSRLYFAPHQRHDGMLLASEVAEVKLNDALVFLAACETGQGRATADGVIGLGRAFLEAGARAVILSLRKVEDAATGALSVHFYRALLDAEKPRNAAEALRAAMLATRADLEAGRILAGDQRPLRPHPANWAPFALMGDGLSIRYPRR